MIVTTLKRDCAQCPARSSTMAGGGHVSHKSIYCDVALGGLGYRRRVCVCVCVSVRADRSDTSPRLASPPRSGRPRRRARKLGSVHGMVRNQRPSEGSESGLRRGHRVQHRVSASCPMWKSARRSVRWDELEATTARCTSPCKRLRADAGLWWSRGQRAARVRRRRCVAAASS